MINYCVMELYKM